MIARGFRPVGWVAGVAVAALSCYMLSLQVASERAELASVERRIIGTQQNIRALQTELGTRGRLQQLERWNADVLALSAPTASQFLDSEIVLARFDVNQPSLEDRTQIRLASADTAPSAPPPVQRAVVDYAAAAERVAEEAEQPRQPLVRRAALVIGDVAPEERRHAVSSPRGSGLLDDSLLAEIGAAARAERAGGN